jgi:hypothetical protein
MRNLFIAMPLALVVGLGAVEAGFSQDLAKEALATFPPGTLRVEFSRPSRLRTLPNYEGLRQRYVGPRLRALEEAFAQLGVREGDIDEVMLAWRPGASMIELAGFVVGRFTAQSIAERAGAGGIATATVGNQPAFCLSTGGASSCLVVLRDSLGLFGPEAALSEMLAVREGSAPGLATDERFARLVGEAPAQAPIWGVAVGDAVADFFRAWLPAQGEIQLDWGKAFQSVEALVYSVNTAADVRLDVKLDCTNDQSAESTRQVFEGLRIVQQMAWQSMNPGKANPFQGLEITRDRSRLSLKMATSYADLQAFNPTGGL